MCQLKFTSIALPLYGSHRLTTIRILVVLSTSTNPILRNIKHMYLTSMTQRPPIMNTCKVKKLHLQHLLLWPAVILSYHDNFGWCNFSWLTQFLSLHYYIFKTRNTKSMVSTQTWNTMGWNYNIRILPNNIPNISICKYLFILYVNNMIQIICKSSMIFHPHI